MTAINQVEAISGLGGIGKTQTAIEYAYRYHYDETFYEWVLWVNADTEINLNQDFGRIAQQLQLPVFGEKLEEQIEAVHRWLNTHEKWLLIFDNADTPKWLKKFIPTNPKGKILITSRASRFDMVGVTKPIVLSSLEPNEAVDFLCKKTGFESSESNKAAALELATELGFLPLALEQAGAYILELQIPFKEYLEIYRKKRLELLEEPPDFLEEDEPLVENYPTSVLTTWSMNFQAVEKANKASAELLRFSAFLAPDAIPYELVLKGASELGESIATALDLQDKDVEEGLIDLLKLLKPIANYSLINRQSEIYCYSIHRMVQEVLRDRMDTETQKTWVRRSISAMEPATSDIGISEIWRHYAPFISHSITVVEWAKLQRYESLSLASLLNKVGYYLNEQGRYTEAEYYLRQALKITKHLSKGNHSDVATSLGLLAFIYNNQGKYSEAERFGIEALEMHKRLFKGDCIEVALSLNNLGLIYDNLGRYTKAKVLFQRALEMRKRLFEGDHIEVATSINNIAIIYDHQGRYSEAEAFYIQALEMSKRLFKQDHPRKATFLNNLGYLYNKQRKYSEAELFLIQALEMRKGLFEGDHFHVAISFKNLGINYRDQERYSEAEPLLTQALEMTKRLFKGNHPHLAQSLKELGIFYHKQGKYDQAKPLYIEALEMAERALGVDHPNTLSIRENLDSLKE